VTGGIADMAWVAGVWVLVLSRSILALNAVIMVISHEHMITQRVLDHVIQLPNGVPSCICQWLLWPLVLV